MIVVGLSEIERVIDHDSAFAAVREALTRLATGAVIAPDEMAMYLAPSGDVHIKGAHVVGDRWIVFKVASGSFEGASNSGCTFVLDASTGAPTLVLDDNGWLTEMRTAAAGALSIDLLASPGPLRVAVIGTGVQSDFQVRALRRRRDVTDVRIWGRTSRSAERRATDLGATAVGGIADAVDGADVIITATSATDAVLTSELIRPGTHITAMGADTVGKQELDREILRRAEVIIADDVSTCSRVGELQHAEQPERDRAASLAELVVGTAIGRTSPADITVADLCGIGTYDAAIGGLAADRLVGGGVAGPC